MNEYWSQIITNLNLNISPSDRHYQRFGNNITGNSSYIHLSFNSIELYPEYTRPNISANLQINEIDYGVWGRLAVIINPMLENLVQWNENNIVLFRPVKERTPNIQKLIVTNCQIHYQQNFHLAQNWHSRVFDELKNISQIFNNNY